MTAPETTEGVRIVAQPVAAPLTRAAIFLVVTVNPGDDHRATIRAFCEDFPALVRAVAFRDLEGYLSCVIGFGSSAWDQLFGAVRPAGLHGFREFHAGSRHAVSTPGDILLHIRAARMWRRISPGVDTAWRDPAWNSRNPWSPPGRAAPKRWSQAEEPNPITQDR